VEKINVQEYNGEPILEGTSLNVFTVENKFRQLIFNGVKHRYFDSFIILIILLSAI
jgi:hypothetical protein